jgi:hypothetical protein
MKMLNLYEAPEMPADTPAYLPEHLYIENGRIVAVTPALAASWLGLKYKGQRKLRSKMVNRHMSRMIGERWLEEGQITFAQTPDGKFHLVDGQHRLEALIKAGRTCRFSIRVLRCENEKRVGELYASLDIDQTVRGPGDQVRALLGERLHGLDQRHVAAILSIIKSGFLQETREYRLDSPDIVRLFDDCEAGFFALHAALNGAPNRSCLRCATLGAVAVYTLQYNADSENAKAFWRRIARHEGSHHSPAWALCQFYEATRGHHTPHLKIKLARAASLAWNAHCKRESLSKLNLGSMKWFKLRETPLPPIKVRIIGEKKAAPADA